MKVDRDGPPVAVDAFDGVDEVEVGDPGQVGRRLPLPRGVVGARGREAGVANQETGHLMIGDVVGRRRRQDDRGLQPPQGLGDPPP